MTYVDFHQIPCKTRVMIHSHIKTAPARKHINIVASWITVEITCGKLNSKRKMCINMNAARAAVCTHISHSRSVVSPSHIPGVGVHLHPVLPVSVFLSHAAKWTDKKKPNNILMRNENHMFYWMTAKNGCPINSKHMPFDIINNRCIGIILSEVFHRCKSKHPNLDRFGFGDWESM